MPKPDQSHVFSNIMYHFGRGVAFAKQRKFDNAGTELDKLREWMKDTSLQIPFVPFSPSINSAKVAEQLLLGVIHEERNLHTGAIRHYRLADSIEVNMVYNEPRDWMLNPKHLLGNAYLKAGRTNEAKLILEKDLRNNNENGWALFGIWQALTKQNKTAEAAKIKARFRKAFAKKDVEIYGPVF
jgi:tetratricopeptide (TPR) repeat protein